MAALSGPEFCRMGCAQLLPYSLLKLLSQPLALQGPLTEGFLWGTCLSVDCIVVVSQVRLFLIPYFCDSILVFGRVQMPICCSDHGREVILKSPFEKYFLSDFVSINAFKNK